MKFKRPNYYIGKYNKIKVSDIIIDFELSHFKASAIEYILRSGKKKEKGMTMREKEIDDIKKAIHHLTFELEKLSYEK